MQSSKELARRDKKAFLSDQCKEIEENDRMGRTRDLLKKIRYTKGTFHAKMSSIKDRNGMALTEAEILRRGGKNAQKNCTKKINHLEPNMLECEVKWALGNITTNKASGGDRIPVELFQVLEDDAMKVLHSICQQMWKTQQWSQDWKRSVFIAIPKEGNTKES